MMIAAIKAIHAINYLTRVANYFGTEYIHAGSYGGTGHWIYFIGFTYFVTTSLIELFETLTQILYSKLDIRKIFAGLSFIVSDCSYIYR